ncbi:MAG: 3-deoxy-manno-octulosonate cytidylyltransferase [Hyphomicrobiales bacterium]|nr:3-deoxy-manno-octulosonate cytidylyltransferase [Hyphomicrobiales bacterium]
MPSKSIRQDGRVAVIIPSRLGSHRLPGKPLAEICGEAMIVHVWRAGAVAAERMSGEAGGCMVVVAGDDAEIIRVIEDAGGVGVLTREGHASGTDRIFEALERIDSSRRYGIIVNLQGDMPDFPPEGLSQVVDVLVRDGSADIATLVGSIRNEQEASDRHVVKAVLGEWQDGIAEAVDFTRAPAKWEESGVAGPFYHHVGIYAYRRPSLERFVSMEPSEREVSEGLEQLRALDSGMKICAAMLEDVPVGVDTPEDLEQARERFLMKA